MKLAIIQQWDISLGYYDLEFQTNNYSQNDIYNYINYLKKKYFVIYNWNRDEDGIEQTVKEFIHLLKYLNNVQLRVPVRRSLSSSNNKKYKLKIIKEYQYANRDFCLINYSFERFIKKCKKYYSQKLAYYKSPKSLLYREIYGKYNFKFNNVL